MPHHPTPGTIGFQHSARADQSADYYADQSLMSARRFIRRNIKNWNAADMDHRTIDREVAFAAIVDALITLAPHVTAARRFGHHTNADVVQRFLDIAGMGR